jgi:hypothetical protein
LLEIVDATFFDLEKCPRETVMSHDFRYSNYRSNLAGVVKGKQGLFRTPVSVFSDQSSGTPVEKGLADACEYSANYALSHATT